MESAEHAFIGDQVTLQFESGGQPSTKVPLALPLATLPGQTKTLTYGQLIALAGDFYGVVGAPISTSADHKQAFRAAFQSLGGDWNQTQQILKVMGEEISAVEQALKDKRQPSDAYAMLGDSLSMRWNVITGGANAGALPTTMGRYLLLAAENWDHFAGYAVMAYRAGHAVAMEEAAAIAGSGMSTDEKTMRLQGAYALNAFADHFLTDLFSAGHLRVPRKELYAQVTTPIPGYSGSLGSLLARAMHDEDCRNGLTVHNEAGRTWTAYGDKRLLDDVGRDNLGMAVKATQLSATDVWNAYRGGAQEYRALTLVPNLDQVQNVATKENYSPLFHARQLQADRRNNVHDRQDFSWTNDWWGWSTYAELIRQTYKPVQTFLASNNSFAGWLGVGGNDYAFVQPEQKNASQLAWYVDGEKLYLRKQTASTYDRYLGEGWDSYADWGLWTGNFAAPVKYNPDQTVTLFNAPNRKLYLHTGNQLRWSNGETNVNFVRISLPLGG